MIPQKNLTNEGYFEGKCEFRSLSFRVKSNNHLTSDWWALRDSNPRPAECKSAALTN
jgi:hypothetical protein